MITEEDKDKLIATLTLQLQEKEKENQELLNSIKIKDLSNINFIQVNEDGVRFSEGGVLYEYNKKENAICKIIDQTHQDKISFAIAELEKVKELVDLEYGHINIIDTIDNQIKQLKETSNEK